MSLEGILTQINKEMNIPGFNFKAKENEQLTINIFNGKLRFTVWAPQNSQVRGPLFAQSFTDVGNVMFKNMINDALTTMTPDSRKSIVFSGWTKEKGSFPVASLILGKDEKQVFYFEIQFKHNDNNKVLKFPISCGATIQDSTEFTPQRKSMLKLEAIKEWYTTILPVAVVLSSIKTKFNNGGGVITQPDEGMAV
jgi:hypothetical protein